MVKAKTTKEAKPVIKESRMETIESKGYKDIYTQNEIRKLRKLVLRKEFARLYIQPHLERLLFKYRGT